MSTITYFPIKSLKLSKQNVRKTGGKNVDDLAASISAIGLQQNLGVVEAAKGYEVIYGGRRLRALQQLDKAGELPGTLNTQGIPCIVMTDIDAHQASLAENTVREAMHPLDQFKAFEAMEQSGTPIPDIAAAFGVSDHVVEQRLRLARVSPKLLKAFGDKQLTLEQLQAFAVTDDQAQQERVWKESKSYHSHLSAPQIRRELLRDGVTSEDSRVLLVGLDTYLERGGAVKRDLFSDTVVVLDLLLLDSLHNEYLQALIDRVKAEGWSWVQVRPHFSAWSARFIEPLQDPVGDALYDFDGLSAEEQKLLDEEQDMDAIDQIEEKYRVWPDDAKARAGAVITHGGTIFRGVLADDADDDNEEESGTEDGLLERQSASTPEPEIVEPVRASLPGLLVQELTTLKTVALRNAIRENPVAALQAFVMHLAREWHSGYVNPNGIKIRFKAGIEQKPGAEDAFQLQWHQLLSRQNDFTTEELLELQAFLLGESVNLVAHAAYQENRGDGLCQQFGVDMRDHWTADEAFCMRLNADMIRAALEECGTSEAEITSILACKKPERSGRAAKILADAKWLPDCLKVDGMSEAASAAVKVPT